jgi:hypothetical protein
VVSGLCRGARYSYSKVATRGRSMLAFSALPLEAGDSPMETLPYRSYFLLPLSSCFLVLRSVTDAAHRSNKTSPPSRGRGSAGLGCRFRFVRLGVSIFPSYLSMEALCNLTREGRRFVFFCLGFFGGGDLTVRRGGLGRRWILAEMTISVAEPRWPGHNYTSYRSPGVG